MSRFIDFIRHGNAIGPVDRERTLSKLGVRQTLAFGLARRQAGEYYGAIITSGISRAVETGSHIIAAIGTDCQSRIILKEMFDPAIQDRHSKEREAAYAKLGAQSLARYHEECLDAMDDLSFKTTPRLQVLIYDHCREDNTLVVGHGVYTNQIILNTFDFHLTDVMKSRLLGNPPLTECAGYRLVFDDESELVDMLNLPSIILDC